MQMQTSTKCPQLCWAAYPLNAVQLEMSSTSPAGRLMVSIVAICLVPDVPGLGMARAQAEDDSNGSWPYTL